MSLTFNHFSFPAWPIPDGELPFIETAPHLHDLGEKAKLFLKSHPQGSLYPLGFITSGSSGSRPKVVLFSQKALEHSARSVNEALGVKSGDVWCCALPTYHIGGFMVYLRAHLTKGRVIPFTEKWDAQRFTQFITPLEIHWLSLVPTQVADLVENHCPAPTSLKAVIVGGGGLTEATGQAALDLGWPIVQSYGSSESASQIATAQPNKSFFSAKNIPILPHWTVRVEGDVSDGEIHIGRLQIKGDALFSAYLIQTLEGGFELKEREGDWWTLNDVVELRTQGTGTTLTFLRRADRVVKILGELVDLDALENEWQTNKGEGYIIPLTDERRGYKLILCVPESSSDVATSLDQWNKDHPGPFRIHNYIMTRIPRNNMGKLDRITLTKFINARILD